MPEHRRANCATRYCERRVESGAGTTTVVRKHVAGFRIRLEQKRNAVCAPLLGSLRADQGPLKRKFQIRSFRLQRESNIKMIKTREVQSDQLVRFEIRRPSHEALSELVLVWDLGFGFWNI